MKYKLFKNASKKNIDYLSDLFGIKLIFLRSESNITTFLIMDATYLCMSRF